jgi:predicted TIM-barrel fold metal-dependent hydrolase
MARVFTASADVTQIRAHIDHPIIDGDGHLIEYLPLVKDIIRDVADPSVAERFQRVIDGSRYSRLVPPEKRRETNTARMAFWGLPTRNTIDRATAMLPRLMYQRLDELGIDYALLYPTYGLTVTGIPDDELRQAMARAFNIYYAEVYDEFRDRLEPVAAIPTFTPDEAIAELDHAVGTRGLKTVMMAGVIPRFVPGLEGNRAARWIDSIGHDSPFDYDPMWAKCVELGVVPTFHAGGQGWGTRASTKNYVFNHLGNFAAAGEASCRGLLMGGAPMRFPDLKFSFLEGGVAWACQLFADTLGHWAKRNKDSIGNYDPAALDRPALASLFAEYANGRIADSQDRLPEGLHMLSDPDEEPALIDEFAESGITSPNDIVRMFREQFHFGCEADDPMNALAFNTKLNPHGTRLNAVFASDIGHWDVPDMREVLPEAWELVEDGHLDEDDFREFTFANVARMVTTMNPGFFKGTAIEGIRIEK